MNLWQYARLAGMFCDKKSFVIQDRIIIVRKKYVEDFEAMYDVGAEGNHLSFKTCEVLNMKEQELVEHSPIVDFDK